MKSFSVYSIQLLTDDPFKNCFVILFIIFCSASGTTYLPLIVCENNASSIQCATSIVILSAMYGRTNNITCPSKNILTTTCESNTPFKVVNNRCTGQQKCTVYANNSYGDPCSNTYKYLNVSYQCSDTQYITTADITESGYNLTIGTAVGVSLTVLLAFSLAGVIVFLRRRSKLNENGNERIISENASDYLRNQHIAMPDTGNSTDYTELKPCVNSHKYQDLKAISFPPKTMETSYDYIDTFQHTLSSQNKESGGEQNTKITNQLPKVLYKKGNSYLTRVSEDANIDPTIAAKNPQINGHDYVVLDPKETGFDRSIKTATSSAESYVMLDPTMTGYNRSQQTLNDQNGYELAKPTHIMEKDNKGFVRQTAHRSPDSQNELDYNTTNVQKINQRSENLYSHAVDTVYDTTKHDRKDESSDNTYNHFFGQKTEYEYDMVKKH